MTSNIQHSLEVVLTPQFFPFKKIKTNHIVVVVDILRASTTICQALASGVNEIIPVSRIDEAREYKNKGFIVAGERGGQKLDFCDYDNSPLTFINKDIQNKKIVLTTTNGIRAIEMAKNEEMVVIGSFSNLGYLSEWIVKQNKSVVIFCSGWDDRTSLEDTVFAGALSDYLVKANFKIVSDSVYLATAVWENAKSNLAEFLKNGAHYQQLIKPNKEDDFYHSLKIDPQCWHRSKFQ